MHYISCDCHVTQPEMHQKLCNTCSRFELHSCHVGYTCPSALKSSWSCGRECDSVTSQIAPQSPVYRQVEPHTMSHAVPLPLWVWHPTHSTYLFQEMQRQVDVLCLCEQRSSHTSLANALGAAERGEGRIGRRKGRGGEEGVRANLGIKECVCAQSTMLRCTTSESPELMGADSLSAPGEQLKESFPLTLQDQQGAVCSF